MYIATKFEIIKTTFYKIFHLKPTTSSGSSVSSVRATVKPTTNMSSVYVAVPSIDIVELSKLIPFELMELPFSSRIIVKNIWRDPDVSL